MTTEMERFLEHGVLCFGGEDWWYHNRGHCDMQMMRQLSRYAPVVYINSVVMRKFNVCEGRMFWRRFTRKLRSIRRGLVRIPEGFWVYSPLSAPVHHVAWLRPLNEKLIRYQMHRIISQMGMTTPLLWVCCPVACDTALALPRQAIVYQRTDRYEEYPGVDSVEIARCDRRLKREADLTFFSNRRLFEEEAPQCRNAIFVDHGVDYDLFARAEDDPWIPTEIQNLRRPIAGFYGGIDRHTFDLRLMVSVVKRLPNVTFLFIGNSSVDVSPLKNRHNVIMMGQKPYEQIPHYAKCFDVCLMPWNQNRWIEGCNPIKLKEYFALGKPVVSTPFPQLSDYPNLVLTAKTPKDFAARIRHALLYRDTSAKIQRQACARRHSWLSQVMTIMNALSSVFSTENDKSDTFSERIPIRSSRRDEHAQTSASTS